MPFSTEDRGFGADSDSDPGGDAFLMFRLALSAARYRRRHLPVSSLRDLFDSLAGLAPRLCRFEFVAFSTVRALIQKPFWLGQGP